VFVPNTTAGVAIALGSVAIAAGDELLTTDHAIARAATSSSGSPPRAAPPSPP